MLLLRMPIEGGAKMPDVDAVTSSFDRVASTLTPGLQHSAETVGWPKDVAEKISVRHSGGALVPHYEGNWQEVEDLEYGTMSEPPKPAIDNYFQSHAIKKEIKRQTEEEIDGLLADWINGLFS